MYAAEVENIAHYAHDTSRKPVASCATPDKRYDAVTAVKQVSDDVRT